METIKKFNSLILKEASKYKIKGYEYEDLVQHGYLTVIKVVRMYKGDPNYFDAYCIKAIRNNYKALLKGEIKHYRELENENIQALSDDKYFFTIEDELIAYENTKKLYKALDKLSKEEKKVIEGFYFEDKSLEEIAADDDRSYNNIRYLKNKALKKLKLMLKKEN